MDVHGVSAERLNENEILVVVTLRTSFECCRGTHELGDAVLMALELFDIDVLNDEEINDDEEYPEPPYATS